MKRTDLQDPVAYLASLPERFPHVRRWCIAYSGGLDSEVLLSAAALVLPTASLVAIHINHQLQVDADAWEKRCQRRAADLGVQFLSAKVEPLGRSEVAARDARYGAFAQMLTPNDALLMAHHADDQAETLLFRLCRGAGVAGLSGMPETRPFSTALLIRPFLKFPRQILYQWAMSHQLEWIEDPSNTSPGYDRNYLRLNVFPNLRDRWPQIAKRFSETAGHMCEAQSLLQEIAQEDLHACAEFPEVLKLPVLRALSSARIQNVLRYWLAQWSLSLSEKQFQQICVQFLSNGTNPERELRLTPQWQLRTYRQRLFLCPVVKPELVSRHDEDSTNAKLKNSMELALGNLRLPAGLIDSELALTLKTGLKNVKIKPRGRAGSKGLSQLFQEAGVPPWLRSQWPLICDHQGVLLVPGICFASRWHKNDDSVGAWQPFGLSGEPFFVSLQYHLDPSQNPTFTGYA